MGNLGGDHLPVVVGERALALAALAGHVGSELDLRVEDDVVAQLGVFQHLVEVNLLHGVQVDGRQQDLQMLAGAVAVTMAVEAALLARGRRRGQPDVRQRPRSRSETPAVLR